MDIWDLLETDVYNVNSGRTTFDTVAKESQISILIPIRQFNPAVTKCLTGYYREIEPCGTHSEFWKYLKAKTYSDKGL